MRARPASARAAAAPFRVPPQPQEHEWPLKQERHSQYAQGGYAQGLAYEAALAQTAAGAQASQALRARPPSATRVRTATDRHWPSQRARMLSSSAEVGGLHSVSNAPLISYSTFQQTAQPGRGAGNIAPTPSPAISPIPTNSVHGGGGARSGLAWASRTHFSQMPGGLVAASPGSSLPPIN